MIKRKIFMAAAAIAMAISSLPQVHAKAAQSISLNIEKVEISADDLANLNAFDTEQERQVSVDVRIEGNESGFLAAEFGIIYDSRLTLETVSTDDGIGSCFRYMDNPESSFIWFSGASGSANTNTSTGRQEFLTLVFTLPEECTVGDVYYVGYSWNALDGSPASWYADKHDNQIDWVRGHSIAGSISIPDPSAPKLDVSEVQINQGASLTLNVINCDSPCIWYSDHNDIANVDNNGVVTAHSPGICTINCYAGASLLSCEVVVTEEYFYSIIGESPIVLTDPENEVMVSYPNPEGMIIWVSTAPDIVAVSDGHITGLKNGTAQVIASSNGVAYVRQIIVDFPEKTTEAGTTEPEPTSDVIIATDVPPVTSPNEPNTTETSVSEVQCGDVDHNGKVDVMDVILINRALMVGVEIDDMAADVVQDGKVNAADSLTLLKHIVKLVETIPVVQ